MLLACFLFLVGMVLLVKGGDWFVDGATDIAARFHIPEMVIGATVVSIGTTIPEVMVSAASAVQGHGSLAYGNAIGSIICNTALVAAVTMTFRPGAVPGARLKKLFSYFLVGAAVYVAAAYLLGSFPRWIGILLLAIFLVFIVDNVRDALGDKAPDHPEQEAREELPLWKSLLLLIAGAALIAVGAELLVNNGTLIATELGVPETVIALTFVALGTSLPELITAITALIKGHSDLSVGNVMGANFFNLVLVSGAAVTLSPFDVPVEKQLLGMNASLLLDIPLSILVMLIMCIPVLRKNRLSRWQGVLLLCIYFAFCGVQFFL